MTPMDYPGQLHRIGVSTELTNYLVSGITSNCRAFQKTVSSFNGMITDEDINELNVINTKTDDTNNDEDFIIDNNIDLLFERAVNVLTSA
ncbi:4419_t:CDS:2 [Funneliformis geosporum]|nr:4419_t:CDS:2 [Funneliformis geosporum]